MPSKPETIVMSRRRATSCHYDIAVPVDNSSRVSVSRPSLDIPLHRRGCGDDEHSTRLRLDPQAAFWSVAGPLPHANRDRDLAIATALSDLRDAAVLPLSLPGRDSAVSP